MLSVRPKWCELIASGKKKIEARKTIPKCDVPFKVYIYCTKDKGISFWTGKRYVYTDDRSHNIFDICGNGKVIGEFICNKIDRLAVCGYDNRNTELRRVGDNLTAYDLDYDYLNKCQLSLENLKKYSNGDGLYGWHIFNLKIYDEPKQLSEFYVDDKEAITGCKHRFRCGQPESVTQHGGWIKGSYCCMKSGEPEWCEKCLKKPLVKPPQSWCYVERRD